MGLDKSKVCPVRETLSLTFGAKDGARTRDLRRDRAAL
jgi:hypothetical protein